MMGMDTWGPAPAELLKRLALYDRRRVALETGGGTQDDLRRLDHTLRTPFEIPVGDGEREVMLSDPVGLKAALRELDPDLVLDVRRLSSGLPVYFLCRTTRDVWDRYGLVVQDLHQSPRYPAHDERFARLCVRGRDRLWLRLSALRDAAAALLPPDAGLRDVDRLLLEVGRHVLSAAWHPDQHAGIQLADAFCIPRLRVAIELLYLCLTAELCALRAAMRPSWSAFFADVYPQPGLRAALARIAEADGRTLLELPRRAAELHRELGEALDRFLEVEIAWGSTGRLTLRTAVMANFGRLDLVALAAMGDAVSRATRELDARAAHVIQTLLGASA